MDYPVRKYKRLLEKKELTYEEALKIATTMELSEKGSASLQLVPAENAASVELLQAGKKSTRKAPGGNYTKQGGKKTVFNNNNSNSYKNTSSSGKKIFILMLSLVTQMYNVIGAEKHIWRLNVHLIEKYVVLVAVQRDI